MHKWSIHVLRLQVYTDQVHAPVPIRSSPGLTRTRTSRRHCTAIEEGKDLHDIRTANHTATKHRTPTAHKSYVCTPCRTFGATCGNVYDRSRRWVTDQEKARTHVRVQAIRPGEWRASCASYKRRNGLYFESLATVCTNTSPNVLDQCS